MVEPIYSQPSQNYPPPSDPYKNEANFYIQAVLAYLEVAKENGKITSQQYNALKQQLSKIHDPSALQQWIQSTISNNPGNPILSSLPQFKPNGVDWVYTLFVDYLQQRIDQTTDPQEKKDLNFTLEQFEQMWQSGVQNRDNPQDFISFVNNFTGTGFPQPNRNDWLSWR